MASAGDWVLLTGASSGIGAELARAFGRAGRDVVLVARSRPQLEALASELEARCGVTCRVIAQDLSAPGAARSVRDTVAAQGIAIDVLVNDAGFGLRGEFLKLDANRQMEMIRLNVEALTELCRLFAPEMVQRGHGGILNVASTAAFQPGPLMAVYCATKAYVLSFTEALAEELRGSGVGVTCLCPGPTDTAFPDLAGVRGTRLLRTSPPMPPRAVAEAGLAALGRRTTLVVPGWRNRLLASSVRLLPVTGAARLARRMLEAG